MKPKFAACAVAILGLGLLTFPVFAHHGTATYDMGNRVTVKGTVVLFDWSNPHSQLHFDASDDKGNVVHWNLECQPPSILTHAGWTKDTLKPGDKITITFSPAKNGTPVGIFNKVVLPNGQELTQQTR
jgi:hypothetical protein